MPNILYRPDAAEKKQIEAAASTASTTPSSGIEVTVSGSKWQQWELYSSSSS